MTHHEPGILALLFLLYAFVMFLILAAFGWMDPVFNWRASRKRERKRQEREMAEGEFKAERRKGNERGIF